jgi:hypothetical protein
MSDNPLQQQAKADRALANRQLQQAGEIALENLLRSLFPPEEAERRLQAHHQEIRRVQLMQRNAGVNRTFRQQRNSQVIPKQHYNAARAWVRKVCQEQLDEDKDRAGKATDMIGRIPTEFSPYGLEKWIARELIEWFCGKMAQEGLLEPHPLGGWMAKRPRLKQAEGDVIETPALPAPDDTSDASR